MTALANDYSYEEVFVGQLQNYGKPGDVVLGISVSGNSPNCVKALQWAKEHGLKTVALVGANAAAWRKSPINPLSSTTRITAGSKTRT